MGSKLVHYWQPHTVQALGGGAFDEKTTIAKHIGVGLTLDVNNFSREEIEDITSYIVGASMLVTRSFLEKIGLMCEDYFLYFEELDWAYRAKSIFTLGFSPESIVYHKVGGSSSKIQSLAALRFLYRNKLKFIARHAPSSFRAALIYLLIDINRHFLKGQFRKALLSFETLLSAKLLWKQGRDATDHFWK